MPKDWTGLVFNQIGNPNDPSPLEDVTLEKLGAAVNFSKAQGAEDAQHGIKAMVLVI